MNVQRVALNNANVRYNNANEETKVYDIETNVQISNNAANGFDGGTVLKGGVQVATFHKWDMNFNPTFYISDVQEQCDILIAINDFISCVTEDVKTNIINI